MEDLFADNYDHIDPSILYTTINIPGKGYNQDLFHSQLHIRCFCTTECNDSRTCACIRSQGPNYEDRKLVTFKLFGESSVLECNDNCSCSSTCANRAVQFGPTSGLKISEFTGKGHGILTDRKLSKGQFVCEYAGEIIGSEEAMARRKSDKSHNYIFSLNEHVNNVLNETIVDATRIGNIGRYINHSCDPNCRIIPVRIDSVIPKLAIFASRNIHANEEITYSYGDSNASKGKKEEFKVCLCGSVSCKKFLPCDV